MCKYDTLKIVELKDWRRQGVKRKIAIDFCIADEIKKMNDLGIKTINSCCGHFKGRGNVLIADDTKNLAESLGSKVREYSNEHTKNGILVIDL